MSGQAAAGSLLTRQPIKGLYVLLVMAATAMRLPIWMIWYIPKRLRPDRRWSWQQAVRTTLVRTIVHNWAVIRVRFPLFLKPTGDIKDSARFAVIPAGPAALFHGITQQDPRVKPATISGVWYPSAAPASIAPKSLVALHFHGGAYVTGDARPDESAFAGAVLAAHVGPSLHVNYRLSSNGDTYPAQLQDAVSALHYLTTAAGVPASQVVLSGDSAGGNLVIALLRYLSRHPVLPTPAAALLWSPWVDISAALDLGAIGKHPNAATDYLPPLYGYWGATHILPSPVPASTPTPAAALSESFAKIEADDAKQSLESGTASTASLAAASDGDGPLTIKSPYLCPLFAPFKTPVPLWCQAGELEVLVDDIKTFAGKMGDISGNKVALHVEPYVNHDTILTGAGTGFVKEAHQSAEEAAKFLRELGWTTP